MESLLAHAVMAIGLSVIWLGGKLAQAARTGIRLMSAVALTVLGTFILSAAVLYYRALASGPGGWAQP